MGSDSDPGDEDEDGNDDCVDESPLRRRSRQPVAQSRRGLALRVYATKDRVNEYNHYHLDRLGRSVIPVKAKNVGPGAAAAPDDKAGNLAKQIPICIGARLMLTSNLWQAVGLCNGARGTVYDIGWAPGAETPSKTLPVLS